MREDDDKKILSHFKGMDVRFAAANGLKDKIFRSTDHHEHYMSLLARTMMNNRPVDFEYFEKAGF